MHQRSILDNQLRVLTATMPHSTSVSTAITVGAGSRYETDAMAGLSHFLEHLPFKGTTHWPTARAVSEAIEGVGGVMNASTDREMTVFWCKVAHPHFRQAFAVLLDLVLNPLLNPQDVEREREVIQEELRMSYDYPSFRVDLLIDEALWPEQAMGRDVGGTPESVSQLSQDDIRAYMEQQYNPANVVVSVAGNLNHQEVIDLLADATRDWKPRNSLDWQPVTSGSPRTEVRLEQRRSDQSHICVALPGLSLTDPELYSLTILNGILGDGMSSRLFLNLREQQSLAYDVHSSLNHFRDCGSLVVYCGVEPRKSYDAVQAVIHEINQMREEVPEAELTKAKEYAKGRLLLRMEDSRAVALWLGVQELLLERVATIDQVVNRLDAVSAEDVSRVAQRLLDQEQLKLAVVGPNRGEKTFRKLLRF